MQYLLSDVSGSGKKALKQVRIYFSDADAESFSILLGKFKGFSETDVATALMSAALAAVRDNEYQFTMPLRFGVCGEPESSYRLNEGKKARAK